MCIYQDERGAGRVANLFSSQLDSEKMIVDEFLPTLKLFATCGWEAVEEVPMYMLGMLLHKTKKRGVSLAITALPTDVSACFVIYLQEYLMLIHTMPILQAFR